MKLIAIVLLALLLAMPCIAMTEKEAAYLKGVEDGFYLGSLAWQARGNQTAADMYNTEVASYNAFLNATLNKSEYAQAALSEIQPIQMPELPPVMR
jgi:hypothetical protein